MVGWLRLCSLVSESGSQCLHGIKLRRYQFLSISIILQGNCVLLEGIDATITKTATIVPEFLDEPVYIFRPLHYQSQAVMKIACEPLNPSELPKMASMQFAALYDHRLSSPAVSSLLIVLAG